MIKHELYKLITTKSVVLVTVAVLVLNVALLWWFEKSKTDYEAYEYTALWEELGDIADVSGWDTSVSLLEERIAELDLTGLSREERTAVRNRPDYYKKDLYADVLEEIEFQTGYADYLAGIDDAAKRYEMISLFGKVDGFAYRDIMKMKTLYADIERIELTPAPSSGVEMAATSGITDILALTALLFIAVTVWLKEKEQNMMLLLRTTCRGRISLAGSRLMVVILSCVFVGVGLYGGNVLLAAGMFGLGDLTRPLASVCDYGHTLYEITAGEFLLLNTVFKILAYIWVMLLISAVCCKLSRTITAFGGIVVAGATGCLMYYKIPYLSKYVAFKYLNPFAVIKTELIFMEYNGLNFFQYPVDYRVCMAVMLPLGIAVFLLLTVWFFTDYVIKGAGRIKRAVTVVFAGVGSLFVKLRRLTEKHTGLLVHEIYRIFICHGAVIIIAVFAVFLVNDGKPYEIRYMSLEYYCERVYLDILKGSLTDEKLKWIEEEEAYVNTLTDEYGEAQQRALKRIKSRVSYIEQNEGACFVYDEPHKVLTAVYSNERDILHMVLCMIPVVLVMPCFFAPDLQTGVCRVTEVTFHGRGRLPRMRYVMGTLFAVMTAAAVHMLYFVQVLESYEVDAETFSYPVNSLTNLSALGNGMSIGTYYVVIYLFKVMFTVLGAFLVYGLSRLIKSQTYTTLAGFLVLVVPALAVLYDMRLVNAMYPYSAGLGNMFVQNGMAAVVCVAAVVAVTAVLYAVNRRRAAR